MTVSSLINARTIFISDVHLGFKDCKADYLYQFLSSIKCETLYLVGDIVDLWSLKRRLFWPEEHYRILLKLYELADQGTRVIYVPGNHDDPLRRFDGQHFGPIEIIHEHEFKTAKDKRFLIMHGDAMDAYMKHTWLTKWAGDLAYDFLLFLNRWSNRLRKVSGRPFYSLAGQVKDNIRGAKHAINRYKTECKAEAKRRGFDGVICGHIHYPEYDDTTDVVYANTGDWIENCSALIEDFSGELKLLHFSDRLEWKSSVREEQLQVA